MRLSPYLLVTVLLSAASAVFGQAETLSFNDGWEFRRDGETAWHRVTVPHDAAFGLGYDPKEDGDQGFVPVPATTYRKSFAKPRGAGRLGVRFDGVYLTSSVRVNGRTVGGSRNGYLPFEVPLEDLAETNVIEVTCEAPAPSTRWYQGVGILRDVWLVRREGWTLEPEDVAIRTDLNPDGSATVRVSAEGAKVVEPTGGVLTVARPKLWTPETPNLHELRIVAENEKGERDEIRMRYGIRTVEFTRDRGMLLNGKPYRIKGVCRHETFGALGAAFNLAATRRELARCKDLGANAIRTTHNPFAPQFYDLCDEMGFLVKDEAFDQWRDPKTKLGYSQVFDACWTNDLRTFVRRDRNHPSVILWSIGNEIADLKTAAGAELTREMVGVIRALDRTRPVTAGILCAADAHTNGVMRALDVVGLNYNEKWYPTLRGELPVFGSETAPAAADRDVYLFDEKDGRMVPVSWRGNRECAYSLKPIIGRLAEDSLKVQRDSPWSAGEFAWCTYDYLGEPWHHTVLEDPKPSDYWPARSSYWGLCDLAGLPKDRYCLYRSRWNASSPTVHLMPDWTHPGCEGKIFPVWCYTNAEEAELFLNGRSQGVRRFSETSDLHLSWDVAYEPGVLEVRAKMADGSTATARRITAGPVARFSVSKDHASDGLAFYRVDAVDANGVRVLACEDELSVKVEKGAFVAADNGDPTDHVPFASTTRRLFRGSLVVIVRTAAGEEPHLTVTRSRKAASGVTVEYEGSDQAAQFAARDAAAYLKGAEGRIVLKADPSLAPQEWRLVTAADGSLVVSGRDGMGIAYGVYSFLEKYAGCSWYAPDTEVIPDRTSWRIPAVDDRGRPAILSREHYAGSDPVDVTWRLRNKETQRVAFGCGVFVGSPEDCHTFAAYAEAIAAAGRKTDGGEFCLTDPEVRHAVAEQMKKHIRRDRAARKDSPSYAIPSVYELSQNDGANGFRCTCANCQALRKASGSWSGPNLAFASAVAEEVGREFPDVTVRTFAYSYTERPPTNALVAVDNLMVRYCRSFLFQPLTAETDNGRILRGWDEHVKRKQVWGYWRPFSGPLFPAVKPRADIGKEMRFCRDMHVCGYFAEAESPRSRSFSALQHWLFLKLAENPDLDVFALAEEFACAYYGRAAGPMLKFLDYLESRQAACYRKIDPKFLLGLGSGDLAMYVQRGYLDRGFFETAERLLDEAERLAAGDERASRHVAQERRIVDRTALELLRNLADEGYRPDVKRIAARLKGVGPEAEIAAKLPTPVPVELRGRKFVEWQCDRIDAGNGNEVVRDAASVTGFALALPKAPHKLPYMAGLYDNQVMKDIGIRLEAKDIPQDGKYHLVKLGTFDIVCQSRIYFDWSWRYAMCVPSFGGQTDRREVWLSVKLTGPTYVRGSKEPDGIFVERVFLATCDGK